MKNRKIGISQEVLKLIACITMLMDHFGASVVLALRTPWMTDLYYACRIIGRIAFPIYCFLLVEGMRRTRNPMKYILRLAVGILLAELPFDFLFEGGISWAYQSVMVTLTLGAVMLLCMQKLKKKWLKLLVVIPFALLAEFAKCDYGQWGIAMIAVFALFDNLPVQFVGIVAINAMIPSGTVAILDMQISIQLFAIIAMGLIACYSGRKLTRSRAVQWGFYLFYPIHLLILWMILLVIR